MKTQRPASSVLLFRGNPREKRTRKQKGEVVKFPIKAKREHEPLPIHLINNGTTFLIGKCPHEMINELLAFIQTISGKPGGFSKDGTPYRGELIFRYNGKDYQLNCHPKTITELCRSVDSLDPDSNAS